MIPALVINPDESQDTYPNTIQFIMIVLVSVVFGIPTFIAFLLVPCGLVCFSANVIQYGMDQLHDAPMEDSILYIHWYVWTNYAGLLPMKLGFNIIGNIYVLCLQCLLAIIAIAISGSNPLHSTIQASMVFDRRRS